MANDPTKPTALFAEFHAERPWKERLPLRVRRATPLDAPAVAAIDARRTGADPDLLVERVRRELDAVEAGDPQRYVAVAEHDGQVVAYGRAACRAWSDDARARGLPTGWYLGGLVVDPACWGRGVGEALTRHRLEVLAARGAREVLMFTSSRNHVSIALHEKLGFELVGGHIVVPGVTFGGGAGLLYRRALGRR